MWATIIKILPSEIFCDSFRIKNAIISRKRVIGYKKMKQKQKITAIILEKETNNKECDCMKRQQKRNDYCQEINVVEEAKRGISRLTQ